MSTQEGAVSASTPLERFKATIARLKGTAGYHALIDFGIDESDITEVSDADPDDGDGAQPALLVPFTVTAAVCNAREVLHGGSATWLFDTLTSAHLTAVLDSDRHATQHMQTQFFRPAAKGGRYIFRSVVIRTGAMIHVVDGRAYDTKNGKDFFRGSQTKCSIEKKPTDGKSAPKAGAPAPVAAVDVATTPAAVSETAAPRVSTTVTTVTADGPLLLGLPPLGASGPVPARGGVTPPNVGTHGVALRSATPATRPTTPTGAASNAAEDAAATAVKTPVVEVNTRAIDATAESAPSPAPTAPAAADAAVGATTTTLVRPTPHRAAFIDPRVAAALQGHRQSLKPPRS